MKKNFNTLNEQMLRMKSLFSEERLYGNLIKEQDPEEGGDNTNKSINPKDEGKNLKDQGYGDKLPEGRKEEDFDVKVDSEGKKWYKEKEEVKLKREKQKKEAAKLKKQQAKEALKKWRKENAPEEEGWKDATHDGNHEKDTENYEYKTHKATGIEFYKPQEKGDLVKKEKRFNQCKKVLRDLNKDFLKLGFGSETEFMKNISTEDNKDIDDNRIKQLQYCIKYNGKKLKKFPKFKNLVSSFQEVYPNGYVEPEIPSSDDKDKNNKVKTPKKYRLNNRTILKPSKKSKRVFTLYGERGAEVAYEQNGKWIISPSLEKKALSKIKEIRGLSSITKPTILKGKPESVEFQINGKK